MTFNDVAKMVADDFKETMWENGFHTFTEMCICYMWDSQDVKEEVSFIISKLSDKLWKEERVSLWMSDDFSFIQLGFEDMSWKDFKKLFINELRFI